MKRRLRKSVAKAWWWFDGDLSGPLPRWAVRLFRRAVALGMRP